MEEQQLCENCTKPLETKQLSESHLKINKLVCVSCKNLKCNQSFDFFQNLQLQANGNLDTLKQKHDYKIQLLKLKCEQKIQKIQNEAKLKIEKENELFQNGINKLIQQTEAQKLELQQNLSQINRIIEQINQINNEQFPVDFELINSIFLKHQEFLQNNLFEQKNDNINMSNKKMNQSIMDSRKNNQQQESNQIIKLNEQEKLSILDKQVKLLNEKTQQVQKNLMDSLIIWNENVQQNFMKMFVKTISLELIYRGSKDGFKVDNFHQKCDEQGETVVIINSKGNVFGGFTDISMFSSSWPGQFKQGKGNSFIFKQVNNGEFVKYQCVDNSKEVWHYSGQLLNFGNFDLYISNDCNLNNYSLSDLGCCYELPKGMNKNSQQSQSYLAGQQWFTVDELEVFKII